MFQKLANVVTNCKTAANTAYGMHKKELDRINKNYAGEYLEEKRQKERNRYAELLRNIREPYLQQINSLCEEMIAYIDSKMKEVRVTELNEIEALDQLNVEFTTDEMRNLISRYVSGGNYWSVRKIYNFAISRGFKGIDNFTLSRQIEVVRKAQADAAFFVQNYESDFVADIEVYGVAMERISANPAEHFMNYEIEFCRNPICTILGFSEFVKDNISKRFDACEYSQEKTELAEKVVAGGLDIYCESLTKFMFYIDKVRIKNGVQ